MTIQAGPAAGREPRPYGSSNGGWPPARSGTGAGNEWWRSPCWSGTQIGRQVAHVHATAMFVADEVPREVNPILDVPVVSPVLATYRSCSLRMTCPGPWRPACSALSGSEETTDRSRQLPLQGSAHPVRGTTRPAAAPCRGAGPSKQSGRATPSECRRAHRWHRPVGPLPLPRYRRRRPGWPRAGRRCGSC